MQEERSFRCWLRERRKALDLTQQALGERVGCAGETIRRLEAGRLRPSRETAERLADQLHVPADERAAFVRAARSQTAANQTPATTGGEVIERAQALSDGQRRHNLPVLRQALLGRERELAEVAALLRRPDVGLVTLTGAGGSGKTRLSLEVATVLVDDFADGVFVVELASLSDPTLVGSAVAHVLGVAEVPTQPVIETLQTTLRDRKMLLVLDNVEHLIAAVPVVSDLLRQSNQLKVLATSREMLRLRDEHVYEVPPLAVPDRATIAAREDLIGYPAVVLFVQRAQAVKADFQFSAANATAVAQLCARLDGLPLAIELAAARSLILDPGELLARLDRRLTVLTGGARDGPARHQTLRATFDWTYDLLTAAEQHLFVSLAVFAGGATLTAAESVCGSQADGNPTLVDLLHSLVAKSLVQSTIGYDGDMRFTMLKTVRAYAQEWLDVQTDAPRLHNRHADFYRARAATAAAQLQTDQQVGWLDQLDADRDNYRTALGWYRSSGQIELALELAAALGMFWRWRGYVQEACRTLEPLVWETPPELKTMAYARVLHHLGLFTSLVDQHEQAHRWLQESATIARAIDDRASLAATLGVLARTSMFLNDLAAAAAYLEESVEHYRAAGDRSGFIAALQGVGDIAKERGELERARHAYTTSVRFAEALGQPALHGRALSAQGLFHGQMGMFEQARDLLERAVAIFRAAGLTLDLGFTLLNLVVVLAELGIVNEAQRALDEGWEALDALEGVPFEDEIRSNYQGIIAYTRGDYDQAMAAYRRALTADLLARPSKSTAILLLERVAQVAVAQDDAVRAGLLLGCAEQLRQTHACTTLPNEAAMIAATVRRGQESSQAAAFGEARVAGRRMSLEQAVGMVAGQANEISAMLLGEPDRLG